MCCNGNVPAILFFARATRYVLADDANRGCVVCQSAPDSAGIARAYFTADGPQHCVVDVCFTQSCEMRLAGDDIDHHMAHSLSKDFGETWTVTKSPFQGM